MQFGIVTIPFDTDKETFLEDTINTFCLNKKVLSYRAEFFQANGRAYWTVFLEYDTPLGEVKETDGLNEADRLLFDKLREWRRKKAEEQGVPVFIIATNKIFKEIAIKKPRSIEALKEIKGLGKKKIERYGKELIEIIKAFCQKR